MPHWFHMNHYIESGFRIMQCTVNHIHTIWKPLHITYHIIIHQYSYLYMDPPLRVRVRQTENESFWAHCRISKNFTNVSKNSKGGELIKWLMSLENQLHTHNNRMSSAVWFLSFFSISNGGHIRRFVVIYRHSETHCHRFNEYGVMWCLCCHFEMCAFNWEEPNSCPERENTAELLFVMDFPDGFIVYTGRQHTHTNTKSGGHTERARHYILSITTTYTPLPSTMRKKTDKKQLTHVFVFA